MRSAGAASAAAESRNASLPEKASCAAPSSRECSREPGMLPCAHARHMHPLSSALQMHTVSKMKPFKVPCCISTEHWTLCWQ